MHVRVNDLPYLPHIAGIEDEAAYYAPINVLPNLPPTGRWGFDLIKKLP